MSKTPEEMAEEWQKDWWGPYQADSNLQLATRVAFVHGYQAAKNTYKDAISVYEDVAQQMLREAVRIMSPTDQLADTSKVMNSPEKLDSCEHILDMEKMVDVNSSNNSNGWISVKERLPPAQTEVLWWNKVAHQAGVSSWEYMPHCDDTMIYWGDAGNLSIKNFTHWMPLPEAPKEEK